MPSSREKKELTDEQWSVIHKFAVTLEKGRFNDYIDTLQNTRQLLWKGFLNGLAKGLGAIIGATVVVALIVAILALLGDILPGELGKFTQDINMKINQGK